jgi:hypothetical protein
MVNCNCCDMPEQTRELISAKAEEFKVAFAPSYWSQKQPPPTKKYLEACEVIDELTGLIIKLLEEDIEI